MTDPSDRPETVPLGLTVASAVLLLAHVPPPVVSVSDTVLPVQTEDEPEIGFGAGLMVTLIVVVAVWNPLLTCTLKTSVPVNPGVGV